MNFIFAADAGAVYGAGDYGSGGNGCLFVEDGY